MKPILTVIALPLAAVLLLGAANHAGNHGKQEVYFGFLIGTERVAAVAIDLAPPTRDGRRALTAYVCDGLGTPQGIAIWFTGVIDTKSLTGPIHLAGVGPLHDYVLTITALKERGVYGAFTEANGDRAHFVAYPAFDGAGIYDVTLDERLHYTGLSTDGSTLDAQAALDGTTVGTIKPAHGKEVTFKVRSLALAPVAKLEEHGLPADFKTYAAHNQVPGSYVAVIAPGGSHWFGKTTFGSALGSAIIRSGLCCQTGTTTVIAEIIGLDKQE